MRSSPKRAWSDVWTVDQVAAYLQLNRLTVYRYIRAGHLPASKVGKAYRLRKADVDWFLDSTRTTPSRPRIRAATVRSAETPVRREVPSPMERRPPREDLLLINPLDWVARSLH